MCANCTVNTRIEIIKSTLESGENIKIGHFGKFDIKGKEARPWRSPFTGRYMMLPPRRVVTFKSFKRLNDKVNVLRTFNKERDLCRI